MPSASAWGYWPEMQVSGDIPTYAEIEPSDPGLFYRIGDYVRDNVTSSRVAGKYSPIAVHDWLMDLANSTDALLGGDRPDGPFAGEYDATVRDLGMLASLARYHACKIQSAIEWTLHRETGDVTALTRAASAAHAASAAWERLAELGDAYADNLVFGRTRIHAGHWRDRLPEVQAAARALDGLVDEASRTDQPAGTSPYSFETLRAGALRSSHALPKHVPDADWKPGEPLRLSLQTSNVPLHDADLTVEVYYREADQLRPWRHVEMHSANGAYVAELPPSELPTSVDLLYYFVLRAAHGDPTLYPGIGNASPGADQRYFVARSALA